MKIVIPVNPISKGDLPRSVIDEKTEEREMYESKKYKEYCIVAGRYMEPLNINFPVNVKMVFYLPYRRKVSLIGLQRTLEEVMVDCNLLKTNDCNVIASTDGSRVRFDRKYPRTEIEITRIEKRKNKSGNRQSNKE